MKFCMLTSFFGKHSFGGDSAYVDRLSRALARRGHDVHVIYCEEAFDLVRGDYPPRSYQPPEGVSVHGLRTGWGPISPLWTQQTGGPGPKWPAIQRLMHQIKPDVVHFHNLSLIGGPGLIRKDFGSAVKFMTAHEHWLVCPMHVLWKSDDTLCRESACHRCSIAQGRPPQWWRETSAMEKGLQELDRLIVPSESAAEEHRRRGINRKIDTLPYFLPDDWPFARRLRGQAGSTDNTTRPYFLCVGRAEKIKGFQEVIGLMRHLPGADLRIAGHGGYLPELKKLAAGLQNVRFEGLVEGESLRRLFRDARAVVVPSLVPETFGYVVLESFAQGRPVLGRDLGALPGILRSSGGGRTFDDQKSLLAQMNFYLNQPELADADGQRGHRAILSKYNEENHLNQYFQWINEALADRGRLLHEAHHETNSHHADEPKVA
jgi:glycosyltransferase involved in cell wall biosynthesis